MFSNLFKYQLPIEMRKKYELTYKVELHIQRLIAMVNYLVRVVDCTNGGVIMKRFNNLAFFCRYSLVIIVKSSK